MDNQQWTEARAPQLPAIRWSEQPEPGKEATTIFLGPVVQGIYIAEKTGVGGNDSTIYTLQLADGRQVQLWSTTILKERMALIPVGSEVRITLQGSKKAKTAGRKNWLDFTVQYAKPVMKMETVGVAPAMGTPTPAQDNSMNFDVPANPTQSGQVF